jgi:hypothetical protein
MNIAKKERPYDPPLSFDTQEGTFQLNNLYPKVNNNKFIRIALGLLNKGPIQAWNND